QVARYGITGLQQKDFQHAASMGYVIKLLATADAGPGGIEASVRPTMLPVGHHLASVKGVFNAVLLDGEEIETFMLYGRGAGARPTASAVVADLCAIAYSLRRGGIDPVEVAQRHHTCVRLGEARANRF